MAQPRSHRRSRSRSPGPAPRLRRDYLADSPASSSASPAVYSRPSSRSGVPRRPVNATANTIRPSALGRHIDYQSSTGQLQSVSQRFSVAESNLADMTAAPRSVALQSTQLPCPPNYPDSTHFQQSSYNHTGLFNNAHDFTVTGTFIDASNITYHNTSSSQFMEKLLEKTIRGAEFDSSDRDPPPRCQPGTRLAVLDRCLSFISNCDSVNKMRWVVGVAGVGKSAIMQSVAESPKLPMSPSASVFFSINGRDDGTKAIITLSYQFAAKSDIYRQVIEREITRDPSLLRSSMSKQFNKLIIEPFIHNPHLNAASRVLVIIDGLDECKNHRTQLELLHLISDLCLAYPSSPLVWLIASRPEPHITAFFSRRYVISAYEKEEIPIDSDEARADVERFLREKFIEIKEESDSLDPRWPEERDFWKIANAAGGLFAYAHTVIRYIGDSRIGSPVSQLTDVLHVIDEHPMTGVSREGHPMALLDALYERILSNIPEKFMINTRKLLLALASGWDSGKRLSGIPTNFILLCNWLGMTADEAYAAVNHLRSVLYVPRRDQAHNEKLKAFHKSFIDYIYDLTRSNFFPEFFDEARHLKTQCTSRILNDVSDGIGLATFEAIFESGYLASGPVTRDKIPLTWLVGRSCGWYDSKIRLSLYKLAINEVLDRMRHGDPTFQSLFWIRFLATVWSCYPTDFPYYELLNVVFDENRRSEFMTHGILKQIPLRDVPISGLDSLRDFKLNFRHPATTATDLSDPWGSSCRHAREVKWEAGKVQSWMTTCRGNDFESANPVRGTECVFCYERLKRQLEHRKASFPDDTALVMFTSNGLCCLQVLFVDLEDGMSEWTYSFWCNIPQDVCKKYGSAV